MEKYTNFNWLKNHLSYLKRNNKINSETEGAILKGVDERNDHALYAGFKAYIVYGGIFTVFLGLMLLIGDLFFKPEKIAKDSDALQSFFKIMVWIPGVLGAFGYFLYNSQLKSSKLWKETLVPFFYITVSITFIGVLTAYELDFINNKIILFMILVFGLLLTYFHNSLVTAISFLGIISLATYGKLILMQLLAFFIRPFIYGAGDMYGRAVWEAEMGISGLINQFNDGYHWLWYLVWVALLGMIPFVKYRIDKAQGYIGLKEAILGWSFFLAMLFCGLSITGGFRPLYIVVIGVAIYLMSKDWFSKGTWFIYRPGSTLVVSIILYVSLFMSIKDMSKPLIKYGIKYNNDWEFYNILGFLFLILLAAITYIYYKKAIEKKGVQLNLSLLLFFPVLMLVDIVGSTVGHYIFFAYVLYLCYTYLTFGLKHKYPASIVIGLMFGIGAIVNKLVLNIGDKLFEDPSATTIGIIFILIGMIYIGAIEYCRGHWTVTNQGRDANPNVLESVGGELKHYNVNELKRYGVEFKNDLLKAGNSLTSLFSGNIDGPGFKRNSDGVEAKQEQTGDHEERGQANVEPHTDQTKDDAQSDSEDQSNEDSKNDQAGE